MAPRRRRRRRRPRLRPPQRHPGHPPRRRHQPQRAGAGRRDPGRRPPPLQRDRGRGRTAPWHGCEPGTVLGHANRVLAPHGRKLGPDPACTDDAATIGGVIANNSGGMRCGVVHDAYSTLRSLSFVLPSGTAIDTAAPGAERALRRSRARAGRWPGGDPRGDPRRPRAERADPAQVRDQEHDRLPPLRLPRRRDAAGDLPPPAGRLRGHPRLRLGGGLRDDPPAGRRPPPPGSTSTGSTSATEPGPRAGRRRGQRGRADGRSRPDRRQPLDPPAPRSTGASCPPTSAALLVEFRSEDAADLDGLVAGRGGGPRPARDDPARSSSRATPRRSRCTGACARACSAWSAPSARPARS